MELGIPQLELSENYANVAAVRSLADEKKDNIDEESGNNPNFMQILQEEPKVKVCYGRKRRKGRL